MRSKDSMLNATIGVSGNVLKYILTFVVRMFFIQMLGDLSNSVNGLFSNILTVLSIAELGLGFAICYSLYKPLADGNENKANLLVHFYKKIYRVIGVIILCLGLALLPFLEIIIGSENMIENIYIIYFLYIIKTCFSYWMFSYRSVIIEADQKKYKIQKFNYLFDILCSLVQLLVLYFLKSFIGYMLVAIAFIIFRNIFIGIYVGKKYPYIRRIPEGNLSKTEKKELYKNIYAVSLFKIGGVVYTSSDTIIIAISPLLSFLLVGYYNNYILIFSALVSLIGSFVNSISASIGNFNITESPEKKKKLFDVISFVNFWAYGVLAVCCFSLISPFVSIFFKSQSVLSIEIVIALIINFVMNGLGGSVSLFKDSCGLFYKGRFRPLVSAILNIIFSVALIYPFGLLGVIIGTILSKICTTLWYDTNLVYRDVFHTSSKSYYFNYLLKFLFISAVAGLAYFASTLIVIDSVWIWILAGFVFFVATNFLFILCFHKNKNFVYLVEKMKFLFKQKNKKEKIKK